MNFTQISSDFFGDLAKRGTVSQRLHKGTRGATFTSLTETRGHFLPGDRVVDFIEAFNRTHPRAALSDDIQFTLADQLKNYDPSTEVVVVTTIQNDWVSFVLPHSEGLRAAKSKGFA